MHKRKTRTSTSGDIFTPEHRTIVSAVREYFGWRETQVQPIAYSHQVHLQKGLQCINCHAGVDRGPDARIPSVKLCMTCHQTIATEKSEIQKLKGYRDRGEDVPWQRVYGFEPSAHVRFNHAPHIRAGVDCASCHGNMNTQTVALREVNHTMGFCMDCHRQKGASTDCVTCHYCDGDRAMQRRDFLKISAVASAVATLEGCKNPDYEFIRFIPEEDLIPGVATWKPSICTLCPAGCGLLVRVMQGEAEVVRNGQRGILNMGLAKKLEGNPAHPINQGKLCARGQAGLQVTYHPDRIQHPLERTGVRGSGQYQEISWDEAIKRVVSELGGLQAQRRPLAFLTNRLSNQRKQIVHRFASAFPGSSISEFTFFDDSVIREANLRSFGYAVPTTLDLGRSKYVLSFGADFLGTWNSPVSQSIGYGQMRQGNPGQRAKLVSFESRLSLTGANADEWIPSPPGSEGALALGLAHIILRDKLRPADTAKRAGSLIDGWSEGLHAYSPEAIERQLGIPATTITRIAHEAVAIAPAVALIGNAAISGTNGLFNALAANALNALLDNVGKAGGILFSPALTLLTAGPGSYEDGRNIALPVQTLASRILSGADTPKVLLIDNANPLFGTPSNWKVREAISSDSRISGCTGS